MDLANLLSHDPPRPQPLQQAPEFTQQEAQRVHQYPTRHSVMSNNTSLEDRHLNASQVKREYGVQAQDGPGSYTVLANNASPKHVSFELLFDVGSHHRARLPMRVQIYPHDTTESIITTVKNWYGLYEGAARGIGFEDSRGINLIASYENFKNNMIVYVKVIPDYSHEQMVNYASTPMDAQRTPHLDEAFEMPPPQSVQMSNHGQGISRPASRAARKQSASPRLGVSRRSASTQKGRSRSGMKSREDSFQTQLDELNSDVAKGYSSSDGEAGSVTSSRKARNEQLASAEISLENIVEGGRRQRAKFESSELPLFVPPQVPAPNSISSISPQRRSNGQDNPSPFAKPQRSFAWSQPLHSPQSYGYGEHPHGIIPASANSATKQSSMAQHGHRLRERVNAPSLSTRPAMGMAPRPQGFGVLPTPDPTIASCISDEDVALQLMRLGDASNISHGRTSASTMDDALSGRAEFASSATSETEDESDDTHQPDRTLSHTQTKQEIQHATSRKHRSLNGDHPVIYSSDVSDDEVDEERSYDSKNGDALEDGVSHESGQPAKRPKLSSSKTSQGILSKARNNVSSKKASNNVKSRQSISKKAKPSMLSANAIKVPLSPASLPPQSRKASIASITNPSIQAGADDEDLSSKPRCQRCRKSKKGCDRQRPCQRCKDAGIGADGCISEDEGNGRKGRFGRHMGVTVQKESQVFAPSNETEEAGAILDGMAGEQEKSKKRKR